MYIPNLSVVCFFICLSYFIFYCALLLFCAQAWHGKTLSSWNDPIFFCSLHWRNLSLYNKITTTHFKLIRFWWKNVIQFRGKVYSNFFKFVQQLFFLSAVIFCRVILLLFAICLGSNVAGNEKSQWIEFPQSLQVMFQVLGTTYRFAKPASIWHLYFKTLFIFSLMRVQSPRESNCKGLECFHRVQNMKKTPIRIQRWERNWKFSSTCREPSTV